MKNTITQAWNHATDLSNSPLLNGAKDTGRAVQSKAGKVTIAGVIMLSSTTLATGIIPINIGVANNNATNILPAEARAIYPGFGACNTYAGGYQPGCAWVVSWLPWNTLWRSQSRRDWLCWNKHKDNPRIKQVFSTRVKGWPACVTQFDPNANPDDYAQSNPTEVASIK